MTEVYQLSPDAFAAFLKLHPCEVWSAGKFYGRFKTMLCAARTAVFVGCGAEVRDTYTNALEPQAPEIWNQSRCNAEINALLATAR